MKSKMQVFRPKGSEETSFTRTRTDFLQSSVQKPSAFFFTATVLLTVQA